MISEDQNIDLELKSDIKEPHAQFASKGVIEQSFLGKEWSFLGL